MLVYIYIYNYWFPYVSENGILYENKFNHDIEQEIRKEKKIGWNFENKKDIKKAIPYFMGTISKLSKWEKTNKTIQKISKFSCKYIYIMKNFIYLKNTKIY